MSGPTTPGSPPPEVPPEVPPEFADAYRAAYERALAEQGLGLPYVEPEVVEPEAVESDHVEPEPVEPEPVEPEVSAEDRGREDVSATEDASPAAARKDPDPELVEDLDPAAAAPKPGGVAKEPRPEQAADRSKATTAGRIPSGSGAKRAPRAAGSPPTGFGRVRRSKWFVPVLLALLAAVLILGAYLVGRELADQVDAGSTPNAESRVVTPAESKDQQANKASPVAKPKAWDGEVEPVGGVLARTGCTSEPGVDASGQQVTYESDNLVDGDTETTWRCDGAAVGERIRLRLDQDVPVGEVGLVPGYAKTDDATGVDRYAENNRVTRVRWTIGDIEVVQRMKADPSNRSMRLLRVPRTTTNRVELEILQVVKGPRDTTAISEIQLGRAQ